jgi:PAS domain S-box-containing protein
MVNNKGLIPRSLGRIALLAAVYFATAKLGLLAAVAQPVVSSAWPPAGVALAALLLFSVRLWPGVALGAFLLNASSGVSIAGAAGIAVGNTLEAVAGVLLLTRVARFRPSLERVRDVLALIFFAAIASTAVSATIGVLSLWSSGAIASAACWPLWRVWWSGDALGILVVAPFLLAWAGAPRRNGPISLGRALDAGVLFLILATVTIFLFKNPVNYAYVVFPLAGWIAVRFGLRGGATATFVVAVIAIWWTVLGRGPFAGGETPTQNLFLLQTFIGLLTVSGLVFAAVLAERKGAEERYRFLFENNPQPMWVFEDKTHAFLAVNEAACKHYGYSREEFLGMTVLEIRPPDEVPALLERLAEGSRDDLRVGTTRHRKKDGSLIDVETTFHSLVFDGQSAHLVLATDVTGPRRLEQQLRQAQKMEAVGRLAGGVAHDFNNVLTAILGYADLLKSGTGDRTESIAEIKKAGERAAALTRQLLAFSRQQVLEPRVLQVNALIENLENMLRRLIRADVKLVTVLEPAVWKVCADAGQLEQVIMNLVVNASDAMPSGGTLTIETKNARLDASHDPEIKTLRPGDYAMLAVTDTGVGMSAETQSHIFEPFFTTKGVGKGTGLGLATVYGIVKQSDGFIWVNSELRLGTSFKIYFPRVEAALDDSGSPRPPEAAVGGSETVLLVEDEAPVRALARKLLERLGYKVLEAGEGTAALETARRHAGPIHLLLTDVVMPGLSGVDLAARVAALRPDTKVLFMSGYTDDATVRHGLAQEGGHFLQKPFTPDALARKLREALHA